MEEIEDYETNPNKPDTDGDGRSDSEEIAAGTDPNASETGVQFVVNELMPSVSQTVSMGGTATDPVDGGSFVADEPYYVRERMESEPTSRLKTQLFFGFDLSGIDPDKGIYSVELVIHQMDKLNGLDAAQHASDLELSRVTEAWDTDGNNYPIFETTTTEDAFIIGNNTQFGAPKNSMGYFGGDPNNPYSKDGLIDVTEIVLGWIKNPDTNHGFRLRMVHLSFTGATFSSVNSPEVGGNEALRLIITLAEPTDNDKDTDGLPDDWENEHFGSVEAQGVVGDPDGDRLSNRDEIENRTDPNEKDTDQDGMDDGQEIAAGLDPLTDDADDDPDFDDLTNLQEVENGTSPYLEDTDGDELLDGLEVASGTDPTRNDANEDLDGDGVTNAIEILEDLTLANNPDTDGDGVNDGFESKFDMDSLDPGDAGIDVDEDGLTALEEFRANSNPLLVDTDEDGLDDFKEVKEHMTNPMHPDSDADGLTDLAEIEDHGTNPNEPDSDLDGFTDFEELLAGTDPNMADEIQTAVTELTPSISQTVSIGGTATDPVDGGSFVADEPYYVRERQASQPDSPLKTQLFFGFDLSGIDTGARLLSARLVVHQMDKLNGNAQEGFASDIELSRVTEAWDTGGENYPIFETTATEDAFIIGNNTQFGAPKNSMGFFGGDPNNPESNDGQIDVTDIVLAWLENPDANHGFRLRMTDLSFTGTTFSSLDNPETDGNEAFRLIITQSESTDKGTELTPSVSQTVSIGGTATDPVDGGSFVADEPYYVRERQASQPDSPLKTQLFFGFDLSGIDTGARLLSAQLVVHQMDKLNGNAQEGFASDIELSRVTEAWDTDGENYPIFETTATEDAFIIGNNTQFGAPKNSMGFFGGDPNNPENDDGQIDVTEIVLGWLENPDTNHGFRLRMTDLSFTGTTFSSVDDPETDGNEAFRLIIIQSDEAPATETEIPIAEFLTVGFNGSESDPASVGAWGASGELFVRERRPNDAAERVKTHLYIRFDLSDLDPDNAILKAHLKIFQIHRLNGVAANIGNLAVGRVIEPWDQDGENYPTYLFSEVDDEFLFGRNDDFGTAANAMGFYGGDPENQADDDGLVDVTAIVQKWFMGTAANNGFRLQMVDPEFSGVAFAQTDNPDTPEDEELELIITQIKSEGVEVPGEAFGVAIALNSATGEVTLSWSAEEGKTYRIEAQSDLGSGEWESITTVTEGVYTETAAEAAQFYRIVEE